MKKIIGIFLALMLFAGTSWAVLIDDFSLISNTSVIDFSEFSPNWTFTNGPVQVGNPNGDDIQWSATSPNSNILASAIGDGNYTLGENGAWHANYGIDGHVGLNVQNGDMFFNFAEPVSFVGGFINHRVGSMPPGSEPCSIATLDMYGNTLETYILNIDTPSDSFNAGEFLGISSSTSNIYTFQLSNKWIVLDHLTYSTNDNPVAPVPEPATILLLGTGLVGLFCNAKRKLMK